MYSENKRNFDVFSLVIGILLIFLGGYSLYRPDTTLAFISIMMGMIAIIKGIYELWFRRGILFWLGEKSGWLLIMGILDIILGLIFIFKIAVGASFIAVIFAVWFIFDAITQLATANFFKRLDKGYYWVIVILSILSLIMGIMLLFNPMLSALTIVWIISIYLITIGILKIIQAF